MVSISSNNDKKELLIKFLKSDTVDEVTNILKQYNHFNSKNWKPLGDTPTNWSTVGNQSSDSVPALVEKLVNCIDHVLINECRYKDRIDPRSPKAPNSIREAVQKYFQIPGGVLTELNKNRKTDLAQRIQLIATGVNNRDPCYTIVDKGEGQSPNYFANTLLSLPGGKNPTNKSGIKFVQGIFNMGGTGVLRFCKYPNYELIISRRNPKLVNQLDNRENFWGFTLIRRRIPTNPRESSVIEYLTDDNNNIFTFAADSIPALPGKYPDSYVQPLEYGTCIKLYEYEIRPKALRSNVLNDFYYELNRYFFEMALPIRLIERRNKFHGNSFETNLAGMSVRLHENRSDIVEKNFPKGDLIQIPEIGEIPITIYAFKSKIEKSNWMGDKPIIFTINGQTHGVLSRSFFSRESVDLEYLEDSLLVVLDCTNISTRIREDLIMNTRDRISGGDTRKKIEEELEKVLHDSQILRELARKRRDEAIKEVIGNNKPLKDTLNKIISTHRSLADIFSPGSGIDSQVGFEWSKTNDNYTGKYFPSFFRLKGGKSNVNLKCPIDHYCIVEFETDASNDYFTRSRARGHLNLSEQSMKKRLSLWNGIAKLYLIPPPNAKIGDKITIQSIINVKKEKRPFKANFTVTIADEIKKEEEKDEEEKSEREEEEKDEEEKKKHRLGRTKTPLDSGEGYESDRSLPEPIYVYKNDDNWIKYQFNELSGLKLVKHDGKFDAYINMDNSHLKKELTINKKLEPEIIKNQFSTGLILNSMAMYYMLQFRKKESVKLDSNGDKYSEKDILDRVSEASDGLSLAILPTINLLAVISKKIDKAQKNV